MGPTPRRPFSSLCLSAELHQLAGHREEPSWWTLVHRSVVVKILKWSCMWSALMVYKCEVVVLVRVNNILKLSIKEFLKSIFCIHTFSDRCRAILNTFIWECVHIYLDSKPYPIHTYSLVKPLNFLVNMLRMALLVSKYLTWKQGETVDFVMFFEKPPHLGIYLVLS